MFESPEYSNSTQPCTTIRVVREREDLRGIPGGTRAVSAFLVNEREALEGHDDAKDRWFVFQTGLDVECDLPFVPRPNPRGQEDHDPPTNVSPTCGIATRSSSP